MLLIDTFFDIVTPESAENGDYAECGMLRENESVTFRELVSLLREGEPSSMPTRGDTHEWVTIDHGETRAWTERGERESHSVHYSRSNPPRKARYWRLAMLAAHGRTAR